MINYTYRIVRNEGNETVIYEPNLIPTELPSLAYIEGPNSSGKSTLLNILAIGLNGINRKDMNKSLIEKMCSLVDNNYQKLDFEVKIDDGKNKLLLTNNPTTNQILVYEVIGDKKKPISPEDYNLIYDIPDNPIDRLNQLAISISNNQKLIGHKISSFRVFLQNQLTLAKNALDPEQVNKLKIDIKKSENELAIQNKQLDEEKNYLNIIEKYTYTKFYRYYLSEVKRIEEEINKLEKDVKKSDKKISDDYNKKLEIISRYEDECIVYFDKLSPIIKQILCDDNIINDLWGKVDFYYDIFKPQIIPNHIKKLLLAIKNALIDKNRNISKDTIEQVNIWSKVIDLLDAYEKKDTIMPGYDKSIDEFIKILKKERSKYNNILKMQENIELGLAYLEELNKSLTVLGENIYPKFKETIESKFVLYENKDYLNQKIKKKYEKLVENTNAKNLYADNCVKKGINITNEIEIKEALNNINLLMDVIEIKSKSEDEITNRIDQLNESVLKKEKYIDKLTSFTNIKNNELESMKNKEPHKYQGQMNELNKLIYVCQELEMKFKKKFDSYIDQIIQGNTNIKNGDTLQSCYYEGISIYLGKKLGEIKYIDKSYKIKSVDIVKKEIRTEEDKIIRYNDMGTGQSQSAYIMGKLNTIDNRKVIALFDEVAMMDKASIEPIFKKMIELHNQGKLVVGIVVQKADKISVREIKEVV